LIFLGFMISQEDLKMDYEKVKEIPKWPSPRNIYEVRSFYRKFIKDFNSICEPIVETIKREHQPFEWTKVVEKGFRLLK
jgi:hypothetical protein